MRGSPNLDWASSSARPGSPGSSTRGASSAVGWMWMALAGSGNGRDFRLPGDGTARRPRLLRAEPPDDAPPRGELTLAQAAASAGVSPATVRRWVERGLIPGFDGHWTPSATAYARVVARLRARGHSLTAIKHASDTGQLAIGPIENLLAASEPRYGMREAARESGLRPELIRRIYTTMGVGAGGPDTFTGE